MAKLIRCPAGHIYDSEANASCPQCARTETAHAPTPPGAEAQKQEPAASAPAVGKAKISGSTGKSERDKGGKDEGGKRPLPIGLIAGGAVAAVILIGAAIFLLRPSKHVAADTDPDFQACANINANPDPAPCDRAIASGNFGGDDLSSLYTNRGVRHQIRRELDAALSDYDQAVKLNPKNKNALNNRGNAFSDLHKLDEALADYSKAIEIDPSYAFAYNNRGTIYGEQGELDRAIADFDAAIRSHANYPRAYENRGLTYLRKGDQTQAIADFEKALSLNPDPPTRKQIEANLDRAKAASSSAATPAANAPSAPAGQGANTPPANAAAAEAEIAKAKAALGQKITGLPNIPRLPGFPGVPRLFPRPGQAPTPQAPAPQPQAANPTSDPNYQACIHVDTDASPCDRAIASGKFSGPPLALLYTSRGTARYRNDDVDGAMADFSQAIKIDPDAANAYSDRGSLYRQQGDPDRALADVEQAIKLNPNMSPAYFMRGLLRSDKRDYDQAIQDFDRAIQGSPEFLGAYIARGDAYRRKGDRAHATADYNKALSLNPNDERKKEINAALYALGSALPAAPAPEAAATQPSQPEPAGAGAESGGGGGNASPTPSAPAEAKPTVEAGDPKSDPDYQSCRKARGDDELAACTRVIESGKFSQDFIPLAIRAGLYSDKDQLDPAINDLDQAIALKPDQPALFTNRGDYYRRKGDLNRAIDDLSHAVELNANLLLAYWDRGRAYQAKGDAEHARADYNKALSLNPDDATKTKIEESLNELGSSAPSSPSAPSGENQGSAKPAPSSGEAAPASNGPGVESPDSGASQASGETPSQAMKSLPERAGLYRLAGEDADGSDYSGMVAMTRNGGAFNLTYWNGNNVLHATAHLDGDTFKLTWSNGTNVAYSVGEDGMLIGHLGAGDATETLKPFAMAAPGNVSFVGGNYEVAGKDGTGKTYGGTVTITGTAKGFDEVWHTGDNSDDESDQGSGTLDNNLLTVNWGGDSPIVYALAADGSLTGLWDSGEGEETLKPKPSGPATSAGAPPAEVSTSAPPH
jgi:tetratricopeptide (TPR) repeat protein